MLQDKFLNTEYVGLFLTLRCNLKCSYCLNSLHEKYTPRKEISAEEWASRLNRLKVPVDVPVTLQGGEPGVYRELVELILKIDATRPIDLLTNLQFDIESFARKINPERLKRNSPYPSIRVSFHPSQMNLDETLNRVEFLASRGFSVGLYLIDHPLHQDLIKEIHIASKKRGIDFRLKEFLGNYNGKLYGKYLYSQEKPRPKVECRSKELLIAPDGKVFKCHRDLYKNQDSIADLFDQNFEIRHQFRECTHYGECHACDIKIKNNRHQKFGHTSVLICEVKEPFLTNGVSP